uniref:Uncharacterized protein n=1 Tax=Avena sativa TaxID=4498 RepID=A0ACD5XYH1_AVESA
MAKASSRKRHRKRKSSRRNVKTVITDLHDTLIIEILSRLPPKSLCCCKCVSANWRYLISHSDNFKKFPQTLAGFFFDTKDKGRSPQVARHFENASWLQQPLIDPSFSFLPPEFEHVSLMDSCNGLLLCSYQSPFRLFVCNPATKGLVMVPDPGSVDKRNQLCLAFDRDVSSKFHIFQIVGTEEFNAVGSKIYSSKTGEWSYKEVGWNHSETIITWRHVFHHGMMHYISSSAILAVDTEGVMRTIPLPGDIFPYDFGYVGQSQGHLYYMSKRGNVSTVSVWFLENYDTDEWALKHRVTPEQLLNSGNECVYDYEYSIISGHPDCIWIYYANLRENFLMAYDIGREEAPEAHVLCSLGRGELTSVFPYVPLYQETLV